MINTQVNIVTESKPMPRLVQKDMSGSMLMALRKLEYGRWLTADDTNIYPRTLEALYNKGLVEKGILEEKDNQHERILYRLTIKGHKFINLHDKTPIESRGRKFFTSIVSRVRN